MTTLDPGPRFGRAPRLGGPSRGLRWALLALVLLLPLLLLLLLFVSCRRDDDGAAPVSGALGDYALQGDRGSECLRLTLLVDSSGSMQDYSGARDAALARLVPWLATNLRSSDELAVIDFAETADVRLPPTTARSAGPPTGASATNGGGTLLEPALTKVDEFGATRCGTALLLLSDAQVTDVPTSEAEGRALLRRHRISDVKLLVPGQGIQVPDSWTAAFPSAQPRKFDGYDADATAVAIGRTVAELTGQKLARPR